MHKRITIVLGVAGSSSDEQSDKGRRDLKRRTIIIADRFEICRLGLRALVQAQAGGQVVAEADSAEQADALVTLHQPEVLVVDLLHTPAAVLELIKSVRHTSPGTRIIVWAPERDPIYERALKAAGAHGYVTKSQGSAAFVAELRLALSAAGSEEPSTTDHAEEARGLLADLSGRERDVLTLMARGYTYQEIAVELDISPNSVGTYRARVAEKLGIHGRTELLRFALRAGLA